VNNNTDSRRAASSHGRSHRQFEVVPNEELIPSVSNGALKRMTRPESSSSSLAVSVTAAFYANATKHKYPNEPQWPDWREEYEARRQQLLKDEEAMRRDINNVTKDHRSSISRRRTSISAGGVGEAGIGGGRGRRSSAVSAISSTGAGGVLLSHEMLRPPSPAMTLPKHLLLHEHNRVSDTWRVLQTRTPTGGGGGRNSRPLTPLSPMGGGATKGNASSPASASAALAAHYNGSGRALVNPLFAPITQQGTFAELFFNTSVQGREGDERNASSGGLGAAPSPTSAERMRHAIDAQRLVAAKCASIDDEDPLGNVANGRGCLVRPSATRTAPNTVAARIMKATGTDPTLWSSTETRTVRRVLADHNAEQMDVAMPRTSAYLKRAAAVYEQGPRMIKRYIPPSGYCVVSLDERAARRKARHRGNGFDSEDDD